MQKFLKGFLGRESKLVALFLESKPAEYNLQTLCGKIQLYVQKIQFSHSFKMKIMITKWTNHRLLAECAWLLPFCFLGYLKVVMSSCHTIFASKELRDSLP